MSQRYTSDTCYVHCDGRVPEGLVRYTYMYTVLLYFCYKEQKYLKEIIVFGIIIKNGHVLIMLTPKDINQQKQATVRENSMHLLDDSQYYYEVC